MGDILYARKREYLSTESLGGRTAEATGATWGIIPAGAGTGTAVVSVRSVPPGSSCSIVCPSVIAVTISITGSGSVGRSCISCGEGILRTRVGERVARHCARTSTGTSTSTSPCLLHRDTYLF